MAKGDENIPSMLAIPDTVISLRKRKFFSFDQSPLARKIIVFNLIALGILVSGVLYLNQTDDGQVSLRRDVLAQQAKLVAISLAGRFGSGEISESYFLSLTQPIGAIVRYYDQSGKLLYQHNPDNLINADGVTPPKRQSALTNMMQNIWEALSGPIENSAKSTDNLYGRFDQLVNEALAFPDSVNQSTFTSQGDLFVSIAEPVKDDGSVRGVVLLSTVGGEIDGFIRDEREQILQIFVLAILSSIALSIVLANSIARPLRRLSEAAETAHANAGGRLNPAMIQIPDLTARPDEIGDLSRAMRKMIEALFERIEENKNFAADVAHEIKNPLTSLRSAVETMELPLEPEDRSALLLIIRDDVDRLDRLVTDISNASRLEAELVREVPKPVDLKALLIRLVEHLNKDHPEMLMSVECGSEPYVINGLEGRLAQVFVNLITNATGFVPADGWIKVSMSHDGKDMIEIRVTDNGPGIPPDNLDDVFERFYSERPESQFGEHSGLGLAISRQIIETHNGTIIATNVPKQGGAQFIIRLPA